MTPSLVTTIAGLRLETCVYNASGPRTGSSAALAKIASSRAGGVLAKSATLAAQTGNPQPRTWHDTDSNGASLNSEGLPNAGIDYYISKEIIEQSMVDNTSKPYMVSISGVTLKDNLTMLEKILKARSEDSAPIGAVELNLACPNVIGKPIIAYDFDQMDSVLGHVSSKFKGKTAMVLGVKLPPYFDGPHFEKAAQILNQHKDLVGYVACINTIGNAMAIDVVSEAPVIAPKGGLGGLSGRAVKYTALANVHQMRKLLDQSIDVVGVGGIETGQDVFEMLLVGATAVQVGTCHWKEGPKCFDRICEELEALMSSKGYSSVQGDVIGKLKPWSKDGAAKSRAQRKKAQGTTTSAVEEKGTGMDFYMILSAILFVVVSVLLGDKFGILEVEE